MQQRPAHGPGPRDLEKAGCQASWGVLGAMRHPSVERADGLAGQHEDTSLVQEENPGEGSGCMDPRGHLKDGVVWCAVGALAQGPPQACQVPEMPFDKCPWGGHAGWVPQP